MFDRKKSKQIATLGNKFLNETKKEYQEGYRILKAQDDQIKAINKAEAKYEKDGDINALIIFWEGIFNSGGLKFGSMKWTFRLPDLYIKVKRYDDALKVLDTITDKIYIDKVQKYREKIAQKKSVKK